MKIKDLTEDYESEFRMQACLGLQMISDRLAQINQLKAERKLKKTRIQYLEGEIENIGEMEVEDLVVYSEFMLRA